VYHKATQMQIYLEKPKALSAFITQRWGRRWTFRCNNIIYVD